MASPVELSTGEDTLDEPKEIETVKRKTSPVIEIQLERTGKCFPYSCVPTHSSECAADSGWPEVKKKC